MADTPYTADQLAAGVASAIAAHDFEAVEAILRALLVVDAERAALIYDTLKVGLAIGRGQ